MTSNLNSILIYTNNEKEALEKYVTNNAEIVNIFFERGIESEKNTDKEINLNANSLEKIIRQILNIYSIMYKNVKKNYISPEEKFFKVETKEILERLDVNTRLNGICVFKENEIEPLNEMEGKLFIIKEENLPYIKYKDVVENFKDDIVLFAPFIQIKEIRRYADEYKNNCLEIKLEKQKITMVTEAQIHGLQNHIFENVNAADNNLKKYLELDKLLKKELMQRDTFTYRLASRSLSKEDREKIDLEVEKINTAINIESVNLEKYKNNYIEWKENTNYYIRYMCEKIRETIDNGYQKELEQAKKVVKEQEMQGYKDMLILSKQNALEKLNKNKNSILKITDDLKKIEIKQEKFKDASTKLRVNYSPYSNIEKDLKQVNILLYKVNTLKSQIDSISLEVKDGITFDNQNKKINSILKINMDIEKWIKDVLEKELQDISEKELLYFKRAIFNRIEEDKAIANMKLINEENEKIKNKSNMKKFLDKITGQAKQDEFILKQNDIKEKAIREKIKDIKAEVRTTYSTHDMVADLDIFIKENMFKEVIEKDIHRLKTLRNNIGEIFRLKEESIDTIIENRLKNNLPLQINKKKMNKFKKIEMQTQNFLIQNKYIKTEEDMLSNILGENETMLADETKKLIAYIEENKN